MRDTVGTRIAAFFGILVSLATSSAAAEIFELRIYTANEGKFEALHDRFRNHTLALFEKHGMHSVGYWVDVRTPDTLVYIISHESADVIESNWQAFMADPAWEAAYQASIVEGKLVTKMEGRFMWATDYSPAP